MKSKLLLPLLLILYVPASGQMKIGHHYKIKSPVKLRVAGDPEGNYTVKKIPGGKRKAAITPTDKPGILKIDFWRIGASGYGDEYVRHTDPVDTFFWEVNSRPSLEQAKWFLSIPYAVTEIGAVTIPFKYYFGRPGVPNNVVTDINAGLYAGRKWGRTRFYRNKDENHDAYSVTVAGVLGLTKIEVSEETTLAKRWKELPRKSNELGLSLGAAIFTSYRGLSLGLIAGTDVPFSKPGFRWMYACRPWIGIGIGYKIGMLGEK